jgi:hypothetical protein
MTPAISITSIDINMSNIFTILDLINLPEILIEVFDILLIHLLLSILELFHPDMLVFPHFLDYLAHELDQLVRLIDRQEVLVHLAEVYELLYLLLELTDQVTKLTNYKLLNYKGGYSRISSTWSLL